MHVERLQIKTLEIFDALCGGIFHFAQQTANSAAPDSAVTQNLIHTIRLLYKLDAVIMAEDGGKRLCLRKPRQLFLGVMKWPPSVFMNATLEDLADAIDGFKRPHAPKLPSKETLETLLRTFPDKEAS